MQKFCHHCGKQMPTAGAKFCAFCGTSLSSLLAKPEPIPSSKSTFIPFVIGSDDDEDDDIDHLTKLDIRINQLQVDIVKDNSIQPETIGSLAKGAKIEKVERTIPYQNVNQKDFLAEFQKEAGALRKE
jgi:hypothetical protein